MGLDDDYNYIEFLIVLSITLLKLNSIYHKRPSDPSLRITNAYFNPCLQIVFFADIVFRNLRELVTHSQVKTFLSTYGHLNRLNLTGHANVELV